MAEIAPIRGILYDPARVDPSRVLAPPYDVISDSDRVKLEAFDPHNCVRLILPQGQGDEKYAAAARTLKAWLGEGVLARDATPAVYRYNQIYTSAELGPEPVTRRGFVAAVRLHRFDEGIIKPHERTLRGPKEDRLKLMRACRAHFSQIFGLYADPERAVDRAFDAACARPPELAGTTGDGTRHELWRVTDRATLGVVARLCADRAVYIADGHHRYETMLALRDELRREGGSPRAPHEFATMFLANMDDPGLVVLPTHRLVHSLRDFELEKTIQRLSEHFEITEVPDAARDAGKLRAAIAERASQRPTFGLVAPGEKRAGVLSLKVSAEQAGLAGPPAVTSLDVTILHSLVLERILGVDRAAQEAQSNITYVKDTRDALERVARGEAQLGFIMHPTRVDQVKAVSDAGEVMPQKSTFFYPKIASGLVINPLDSGEDLIDIRG